MPQVDGHGLGLLSQQVTDSAGYCLSGLLS